MRVANLLAIVLAALLVPVSVQPSDRFEGAGE